MKNLNCKIENLQEIFALPLGVKKVKGFPGPDVYTSDSIKKRYVSCMKKTDRSKEVFSTIEKLVDKELIIPCFLTKNVFRFVMNKIFTDKETKGILGFYMPEQKKIYLLIDNNTNALGFSTNDWIANLTIHEGMHMFADLKPSKFYSVFSSNLTAYYSNVFTNIFKLKKVDKRTIEKIVKFIYQLEMKLKRDTPTLKKYYRVMLDLQQYSSLSKEDFEKVLSDYIVLIRIFWYNMSAVISVSRKYNHILGPLYTGYRKVFKTRPDTFAIQELFSLSEVVSIVSEDIKSPLTSRIYSGFKMIV